MRSVRAGILLFLLAALPALAVLDPAGTWEAWRHADNPSSKAERESAAESDSLGSAQPAPALDTAPVQAEPNLAADPAKVEPGKVEAHQAFELPAAAQAMQARLIELGALSMRLDRLESETARSRYLFSCEFEAPGAPEARQWFQGEGPEPVAAMQKALMDANRWQNARQALLPVDESTQY